jgi:hypothetical protein
MYPGSHTQSVISPDTFSVREYAGHKLQFALPSGDHCPAGQRWHTSGVIAVQCTENRPIEQFEHARCPSCVLYVPGVQSRHECRPSRCEYPGSQ